MDITIIAAKHKQLVNAIDEMLQAQKLFFKVTRQGLNADAQLQASKQKEIIAKELFKSLWNSKPGSAKDDTITKYLQMLEYTKELLTAQHNYFTAKVRPPELLNRCKRLEKNMRDRIKKY